jgi:hypothetical protein
MSSVLRRIYQYYRTSIDGYRCSQSLFTLEKLVCWQDHSLYLSSRSYVRIFPLLDCRLFKIEKRLQDLWPTASSVTTCIEINLLVGESARLCPRSDNSVQFSSSYANIILATSLVMKCRCCVSQRVQWQRDSKTSRVQQGEVTLNLCATLIKLSASGHTNKGLPPAVVPLWDRTDKSVAWHLNQ